MCGICGFIAPQGVSTAEAESDLRSMADRLKHRGPDAEGYWIDAELGVGLGHRRLAVIDLTPTGHQPMTSQSGRYELILNGEIYNYLELKQLVGTQTWRGTSDTEALLAGFERFGIVPTLQRAVGMFALAVWDKQERRLTLARDRLGEKPLYYGWQNGTLLFASELRAVARHRAFRRKVDQAALAGYLQGGYVKGNASIYEGIFKLPPGCTWSWAAGDRNGDLGAPVPYWSLQEAMDAGARNAFVGTPQEAVDRLEELLKAAVSGQLMGDVPVGAFLSGGVDSSTVVALMQAVKGTPVKTFTIGTVEHALDESIAAKQVAHHLGADHTELIISDDDALQIATRLGAIYDEPFGDSSAVPTYLVAKLAASEVTVALSGDGGDELFAGYTRYADCQRVWDMMRNKPRALRKVARTLVGCLPLEFMDRQLVKIGAVDGPTKFSGRARSLEAALGADNSDELYATRLNNWPRPIPLLQSRAAPNAFWAQGQTTNREDEVERMMALDMRSYLPDDILVKVDRAASAHSLETRVPLLDHRIVEFSWTLAQDYKVRGGASKWILRELLYRYVPRELVDRPKQGFAAPVESWLRGPLKAWAEDLLSVQALEREGPFLAAPIRRLWLEHQNGADWQYVLWPILAYQQWARSSQAG